MKGIRYWMILMVVLLSLVVIPKASADQYLLNIDHCTGGCGLPAGESYGTITLTQGADNSTVDVNVSFNDGVMVVRTGAGAFAAFAFNLIPAAPVLSVNVTSPFTPALAFSDVSQQVNGFGDFQYFIQCPTCKNGAAGAFAGPIAFSVTNSGGTLMPSDFRQLSAGGSPSVFFAADILGLNPTGGVRPTGVVGAVADVVPEPSTIAFFGIGLLVVGAIRRRRRT